MVGSEDTCARRMMNLGFARRGDRDTRTGDRAERRCTQCDDDARTNGADLALQPFVAGGHLALRRRLVNAPLTARLPAEMLDRVGQIEIGGRDAGLAKHVAQQLAGRTDEGLALLILLVARLLADQHQPRLVRAFAAHSLRRALPQIAATTSVELAFVGRIIAVIA